MKICPNCRKTYEDDNLNFCLDDGTALRIFDQAAPTLVMPAAPPTTGQPYASPTQWQQPMQQVQPPKRKSKTWLWVVLILVLLLLLCGGGIVGLFIIGIMNSDSNTNQSTPASLTSQSPIPSDTSNSERSDKPDKSEKSDNRLTLANYNRLKEGMPRSEAENILGGKGSELSSSSGGGMRFTVVQWQGKNYNSIIITFQNDKLQYKVQVGLDDK